MDKSKQKSGKKEKTKVVEKYPLFGSDVRNLKENIKIKEILRTVKMNSSMRIKAPQGSKIMNNKDFNENDDCFEEASASNSQTDISEESPSATNTDVVTSAEIIDVEQNSKTSQNIDKETSQVTHPDKSENDPQALNIHLESMKSNICDVNISHPPKSSDEIARLKQRERKLSLDQTMLSRREGLSQSEMDLHSIGKSPLERKSSFFRKKMDSFFRNTTEIFKRQSQNEKSQPTTRRGSMSLSLQSLNEENTLGNDRYNENLLHNQQVS